MICRLVHLSDIHIPPLPDASLLELASKRILGYVSWRYKRQHEHLINVLEALKKDLECCTYDQICITGDLTNIALPAEFSQAADWLSSLAPSDRVSLVPGNHDAYVPGALRRGLPQWRQWLGDGGADGGEDFPRLWHRDRVDVIGVSTAVATPPLMASGRVGRRQMDRLQSILRRSASKGRIRVVLLHHPPDPGAEPWRKALRDAGRLRRVLLETGAELVLHGHSHHRRRSWLAGPAGDIPVLGAGSASALGRRKGAGHYHRLLVDTTPAMPRLHIEHRLYDPDTQAFADGGAEDIELPVSLT